MSRSIALMVVGMFSIAWPLALSSQQASRSLTPPAAVAWVEESINSIRLGEQRRIRVATPLGYDSETRKYPVLLLLDAHDDIQFRAAVANVQFLTDRKAIPPMLVVGILNDKNRTRDLTPLPTLATKRQASTAGGVARFVDFLEQEVIPQVAKKYRAAPYRVIAGHSFGGLTGLWAAVHRPSLVDGVVAISPSLWFNELGLIGDFADRLCLMVHLDHDVAARAQGYRGSDDSVSEMTCRYRDRASWYADKLNDTVSRPGANARQNSNGSQFPTNPILAAQQQRTLSV